MSNIFAPFGNVNLDLFPPEALAEAAQNFKLGGNPKEAISTFILESKNSHNNYAEARVIFKALKVIAEKHGVEDAVSINADR